MPAKDLGTAIRDRRKELGITQPDLAELAGISTNILYKLERGQGNPSLEVISSLCKVPGISIAPCGLIFLKSGQPADIVRRFDRDATGNIVTMTLTRSVPA